MKFLHGKHKVRGVIMPFLAIGMLGIFAMAALAVDMGHSYVNKARLQNALDAAALSAGATLIQTSDTTLAAAHAQDTFNAHLVGELASDPMTMNIEFSSTLVPFTAGSTDPRFVRVTVTDFDRNYFFASVLPNIGNNKVIGASAVSGPIPLGGPGAQVCDIAPLMVCGDPSDTDPSDDTLYGLSYDDGTGSTPPYCLKASSSPGGNGNGNGNGNNNGNNGGGINWPANCANETLHSNNVDTDIGPGNFQLIRLGCGPGGNCVRQNLAGAFSSCLAADGASVATEPGNTVGPTAQGFNTRFGHYQGNVSRTNFPPDLVTTENISYNEYLNRYATQNYDHQDGAPFRRVMNVPIGDCGANTVGSGQTNVPVLAIGCFFMTEATIGNGQNNWIRGSLLESCLSSGSPGSNPGSLDDGSPVKIILYKDPNNTSS